MENSGDNRRLASWKEISQYLGRDVRTCRRWEKKLGLPVHRVDPRSSKSRVYAFRDELDKWLKQSEGDRYNSEKAFSRGSFRRKIFYILIPALGAIALIIFFAIKRSLGSAIPADFQIKGSVFIVLNDIGRELWRYDTRIENLCDDKMYHDRFQIKKAVENGGGINLPWIIIKDINDDREPEVLFCTWSTDEQRGGDLVCFSYMGKELWHFRAGREMWCGRRPYGSHFNIRGFKTVDIDNDNNLETVVISQQPPNWLTQLALLDSQGQMRGEFWNAGHLCDFILADLRGDGLKELLAVGLNNEYGKGCLIVFDPQSIAGGSPQTSPEFRCRDIMRGTEEYYLLFPRSDVDLELNPVEAISEIYAEKPNILSLQTLVTGIYFILGFDLTVKDVTLSHGFMQMHHEALVSGKVNSDINDPSYKEALMNGILYYDGRGWTATPTPVVQGANGSR
jgi:hypothetical protein